ncbi:DUF3558 family protein [Nocardia alba]|uniref:Uncharacterized protein DUF3558 n=1 Tax=Nocardia alba TaxID=225051 RepID=A0A4R1G2T9_9NOCA|nr:DUF3558 family protein [Nocardia alba]TCJ99398.1 uncharacterized protein DUF3558 [Nocardia alba]
MKRAFVVVVAGLASATLVGCASEEPGAAATKTLFEPCTGVTADALRAAGVDPATKVAAGAVSAGWQTCEWTGAAAYLRVFSTSRTLDQFEKEAGPTPLTDYTVAGRTGRRLGDTPTSCDILFPATQGVIRMVVVNNPAQQAADACATLRHMGDSIVATFPT